MVPTSVYIGHVPAYARTSERDVTAQVLHTLPLYLHGSREIIHLIVQFLGDGFKWVSVRANLEELYTNRVRDTYFIYTVFSLLLPTERTIQGMLDTHRGHVFPRRDAPEYTDTCTQPLPVKDTTFHFTRMGHIGTLEHLATVRRTVVCHGHLSNDSRNVFMGACLVITTNPRSDWPANCVVRTVAELTRADFSRLWQSVVLDEILDEDRLDPVAFPDGRHLSGCIEDVWVRLRDLVHGDCRVIIQTRARLTLGRLLSYLYIMRVEFGATLLIPQRHFTVATSVLVRVTETLLLNGVLHSA